MTVDHPCLMRRSLQLLILFLGGVVATAAGAQIDTHRYQVNFGPSPASGREAVATLPDRIDMAARWNACGREFDLMNNVIKNEIGEGMLARIIAKMLWMQRHPGENCWIIEKFAVNELPAVFLGGIVDSNTIAHFNEQFRQMFDPGAPPFGLPSSDRTCEAPLTSGELISEPGVVAEMRFELTPACMRRQINIALMRPAKITNLGTTDAPCGLLVDGEALGKSGDGEWDIPVRDLVRVVYLDRRSASPFLDTATRDQIVNNLITVSGPLEEESYSLFECGNQEHDQGSPQDRADERSFTDGGLFDDLGDLLDWLWNRLKIFAIAGGVIATLFLLGAGWAAPLVAALLITAGTAVSFLRIPESENHLLMINTSRYMMNKLIIEALPDEDDREDFEDDNEDVKEWLLDKLQSIAKEDFREYNARPYQRYSIIAILNLHDFSGDHDLEVASRIVLDFAAAKFAVGSNEGRRIAPFRRLMEVIPADFATPGRQLFDIVGGADHQIAEMQLFTGETRQLPGFLASIDGTTEMMAAASSTYRPDELILDTALNKLVPYEQRIHHDGVEIYSSSKGFLLSAGGVRTGLANEPLLGPFAFTPPISTEADKDLGVAMPTVLMTSGSRQHMNVRDFIRIDGLRYPYASVKDSAGREGWTFDNNICVKEGFACGMNVSIPPAIASCVTAEPGAPAQWGFIDSDACPDLTGPERVYVVLYRQTCAVSSTVSAEDCATRRNWGFIEAIDASIGFAAFRAGVIARNPPTLTSDLGTYASSLEGTYVTANGTEIKFDLKANEDDSDETGIVSYGGVEEDETNDWPFASGDIIDADGDGKITIHSPLGARKIEMDFTDEDDPKWTVQ